MHRGGHRNLQPQHLDRAADPHADDVFEAFALKVVRQLEHRDDRRARRTRDRDDVGGVIRVAVRDADDVGLLDLGVARRRRIALKPRIEHDPPAARRHEHESGVSKPCNRKSSHAASIRSSGDDRATQFHTWTPRNAPTSCRVSRSRTG